MYRLAIIKITFITILQLVLLTTMNCTAYGFPLHPVSLLTHVIFLHFSGEQGQVQGEREVRDRRGALRARLALALARLKNVKK